MFIICEALYVPQTPSRGSYCSSWDCSAFATLSEALWSWVIYDHDTIRCLGAMTLDVLKGHMGVKSK